MKRQRRLRPIEALAGGGGRYRFAEVRPEAKDSYDAHAMSSDYVEPHACGRCGYIRCGCEPPTTAQWTGTIGAAPPLTMAQLEAAFEEMCKRPEPTPPPDDGLVWEEVAQAVYDPVLRAWQVKTADHTATLVYRRDMARRSEVQPGDTVGIDQWNQAKGWNGEVFK